MSRIDLQSLWQSEAADGPTVFSPRELAAHPAPPANVAAPCLTWLERTLEAHRTRALLQLRVAQVLAAGRQLAALRVLQGRAPGSPARPLVALAAAASAVLVVGAAVAVQRNALIAPQRVPPSKVDPLVEVEELMAECRTFADPTTTPDFTRARAACNQALDLEPLHREATALLQRIDVFARCNTHLERARTLLSAGQAEGALEALSALGRDCEGYLWKGMALAAAPAKEVKKVAGDDCAAYAGAKRWDLALPRCELYARLACQSMSLADYQPPPLLALKLDGPLDPKTQWRPADPRLLAFFRARAKLHLDTQAWRCPEVPVLTLPHAPTDPAALAMSELNRRFAEPELNRALVLYFQGHFDDATVAVQRVLETMSKASHHQAARALLRELQLAVALLRRGDAELLADAPTRAAEPFRQALEVDEALVLGPRANTLGADEKRRLLEGRSSALRRQVTRQMAVGSYEQGKRLADRKDFRGACIVWKLGLSFSRAHLDLLRAATNVCTPRAQEAFERATSCEALGQVLDFAVDGDGFREKATATREDNGCR